MIFIAMHLQVSLLEDIQTDVWRMTKLALPYQLLSRVLQFNGKVSKKWGEGLAQLTMSRKTPNVSCYTRWLRSKATITSWQLHHANCKTTVFSMQPSLARPEEKKSLTSVIYYRSLLQFIIQTTPRQLPPTTIVNHRSNYHCRKNYCLGVE